MRENYIFPFLETIIYISLSPLKMQESRRKKLEGLTQELVSKYLFQEIPEAFEVYGIITITGVKVSSDLSYLDVFVSCFKNQDTLAKELATHSHTVQRKLNANIATYKLPRLRFRYDESGEVSSDIMKKIDSLNTSGIQ